MIAVRSSWFLCWVGLLFPLLLRAAEEPVSFAHNGKSIRTDSSAAGFSFWVAGHIYGNPGKSVFPSPSMLAQVDTINASPAAFLILLGDNYRRLNGMEVGNFRKYFPDKLEIAAFNAIGNHDLYTGTEVQNYALYREYFPSTYYRFFYRNCLFLILDSELANGSIRDEQLDFFAGSCVHRSTGRRWRMSSSALTATSGSAMTTISGKIYIPFWIAWRLPVCGFTG